MRFSIILNRRILQILQIQRLIWIINSTCSTSFYHFSSISFRFLFRSTFWSSIDHQSINFAKWKSLNVIINQKRHLSTIFQVFEKCWSHMWRRLSSLRSKRDKNEAKSECRMTSIDELKHSIISNWRDKKKHFNIIKRRIIKSFLNNLILLSSSLTTMRWKSEK
jgi:GT2 family glycosyltransferase